jgi:integrase
MPVMNLTETRIRDIELGSGIWRDEQVRGLMVVSHKTTKTYAVQGDVRRNGRHVRTVRVKIDRVDRIGLREARRRARELMSQIQSGIDPTSKPDETGITLKQALEAHLSERTFRPSTEESYRYNVDHQLVRFRGRAIADLTRTDVRGLFEEMKVKRGKTTAGGAMRVLRALINTAMRIDETIPSNPCTALRIPAPPKRQVEMLDIATWWIETDKLSPIRRDLHRAMLLTGARRSSILSVRRADVDLDRAVLTFRHMKIGGPMLLPMGRRLTEMLKTRLAVDTVLGSEWLWPSPTSACGHAVEPKEMKRADLPSSHEYRHLARTLFIASGAPYAESALLLGQKLPGASGGYIHPEHLVEQLRPFMQALEDRVFAKRELVQLRNEVLSIAESWVWRPMKE